MKPVALVTGLSGVVGATAAPLLASSFEVVALIGRRTLDAGCEQVPVDLRAPRLGLDARTFSLLAERADVVVHMAGNVNYAATPEELHAVNVGGAGEMTALAEAAGCPLVFVSTAFAERYRQASREAEVGSLTHARPSAYHRSKAEADARVRACAQPWSIVRPSIVMGDSGDGSMPQPQNVHRMVSLLAGGPAAMFGHPDHRVDMVPRDYVARTVHRLALDAVDGRPLPREFWATAGPAALTMRQWSEAIGQFLARAGRPVPKPEQLDPFTVRVSDYPGWEQLSRGMRRGMATLYVSTLALAAEPFPTSFTHADRSPERLGDDHALARSLFDNDLAWLLRESRATWAVRPVG
ncbi:SDR family oxidoreductase [Streptomyces sp. NPDC001941]|uniref:SDR family oxidoreductase n=1 Tax=Streptomyces sp. NPDC001941 TaxID=3154659 RepID=UPI003318F3EF